MLQLARKFPFLGDLSDCKEKIKSENLKEIAMKHCKSRQLYTKHKILSKFITDKHNMKIIDFKTENTIILPLSCLYVCEK